jgi:hypothetical protein
MKLTIKIAALAIIALMGLPIAATSAYADDNDTERCEEQDRDDDDCDEGGRKKPKFQTKFFSN